MLPALGSVAVFGKFRFNFSKLPFTDGTIELVCNTVKIDKLPFTPGNQLLQHRLGVFCATVLLEVTLRVVLRRELWVELDLDYRVSAALVGSGGVIGKTNAIHAAFDKIKRRREQLACPSEILASA